MGVRRKLYDHLRFAKVYFYSADSLNECTLRYFHSDIFDWSSVWVALLLLTFENNCSNGLL